METPFPDASASTLIRLPLSFGQEQLWFLAQLSPTDTTYNVGKAFRLSGSLDATVLSRSLGYLVERHECLRASFGAVDGTPFQVIRPAAEVELARTDLRAVAGGDAREHALSRALAAEATTPFDLESGPLYRFQLIQLGADDHVLVLSVHHIVTDGWSMGVLTRELSSAYRAFAAGREPDLAAPALGYADHVERQRAEYDSGGWETELKYWQRQLENLPVLELPGDRLRPAASSNDGGVVRARLSAELVDALRALGSDHGASLFMILAAALNVVLSRYTGQEDIPVGVPVLGRMDPDLEDVVGLFVNIAVLRTDLSGDPTFAEVVQRVAEANLDLYDNQEVPFHCVVERVAPVRDASRNPLFGVSIQVLGGDTSGVGLALHGVSVTPVAVAATKSRFDLTFNFIESADGLDLDCEYSAELFDKWRIEAMAEHLRTALVAVAEDASVRLSAIPLLSKAERAELQAAGRGESVDYSTDPVHVQITAVAHRDPAAVAAVCGDRELTYGELDHRSTQLARYLRARGLGHDQIIAIMLDRDLDALVAMLGVLKAGAAFAMMDPRHPASRLSYQLGDTAALLVITRSAFVGNVPEPEGRELVVLDQQWAEIEATPGTGPLAEWSTRDSLAYVLYTSGSTGRPKGVLVEHRALTCFTEAYRRTFDFTPNDRMLQLPALTFDMSHGEIFTGLTVGATLVLVSYDEGLAPELISDLMRNQRVTFAGFSPAMLALVDAEPYPALRCVMNGGDALPAELVNKWNLPGRRFVNLYGPTEAVIACTEYECAHVTWLSAPPIGTVQLNRQAYVVDRHGNLAPRGVQGELLIGGPEGLARGYLNAPELTAQKFVKDPIDPGGRVYRTGDLVRWTAELTLEFLGRIDNQVKLRGLRIELGEIEAALATHPDVRLAAVLMLADPRGDKHLVAYFTTVGERPTAVADLASHVRTYLPDYMVPTVWVGLDGFPMTAARKIDRKALPAPISWGDTGGEVVTPTDPTERAIAAIYAEVLGLVQVGADGNFFELGGNSLQAMRAISRINRTFGIKVNTRRMYGAASVAELAAGIREQRNQQDGAAGDVRT